MEAPVLPSPSLPHFHPLVTATFTLSVLTYGGYL